VSTAVSARRASDVSDVNLRACRDERSLNLSTVTGCNLGRAGDGGVGDNGVHDVSGLGAAEAAFCIGPAEAARARV
jgi:hypothetical protein